MTVISLSGTSTTTSSRNEPNHTGMLFACVTANNASPQTLPVVPPQNITFSGVEITTAANPAAQAVSNDLGKDSINPSLAIIPAQTGEQINDCNIITNDQTIYQVIDRATQTANDGASQYCTDAGSDCIKP